MGDKIVDLTARRAAAESESRGDLIYCPCGDAWWIFPDDGGVCFATDMHVSGWAGRPLCKTCGSPMQL